MLGMVIRAFCDCVCLSVCVCLHGTGRHTGWLKIKYATRQYAISPQPVDWYTTSHQTHYRSYRWRVLWVKRPNQQCQSTEGREVLRTRLVLPDQQQLSRQGHMTPRKIGNHLFQKYTANFKKGHISHDPNDALFNDKIYKSSANIRHGSGGG